MDEKTQREERIRRLLGGANDRADRPQSDTPQSGGINIAGDNHAPINIGTLVWGDQAAAGGSQAAGFEGRLNADQLPIGDSQSKRRIGRFSRQFAKWRYAEESCEAAPVISGRPTVSPPTLYELISDLHQASTSIAQTLHKARKCLCDGLYGGFARRLRQVNKASCIGAQERSTSSVFAPNYEEPVPVWFRSIPLCPWFSNLEPPHTPAATPSSRSSTAVSWPTHPNS